jgi:hypothetical protein
VSGCPFSAPAVHHRPWGRAHAQAVRREIEALHPQRDCERIVHLLYACEFPFDLLRSTEIALFHSYGSRAVSTLLDRTGAFTQRGQKRYDDTRLLIGQFMEGDGARGIEAARPGQAIHLAGAAPDAAGAQPQPKLPRQSIRH